VQIVHCDIKSKNVLLNKGYSTAKIADCGLSRMLDSHAFSSTGTNPLHGTLAYAAPELLLGYKCTDKVCLCNNIAFALSMRMRCI